MSDRKSKPTAGRKTAKAPATRKSNRRTSPRVTNAIARMRKEGISLWKAAREAKVSPRTVIKRAASALRKGKSGRYAAKTSDRLVRPLMIPTPEWPTEIEVRGLKAASLLGRYWASVHKYYETGDKSVQKFNGEFITATDGVKYPLHALCRKCLYRILRSKKRRMDNEGSTHREENAALGAYQGNGFFAPGVDQSPSG